jgi:aconitate hydratase
MAFAGTLTFNPLKETLKKQDNTMLQFHAPVGHELPPNGFVTALDGYEEPTGIGDVIVDPASDRLQLLMPFTKWDVQRDFTDLKVLLKIDGKCTTDHISPAGEWLKYRGHLDNIANNMFSGAVNIFTKETGKGKNQLTGLTEEFSKIARYYKANTIGWIAVADENYGEGSSREHAAMEPRHLGCRVILAKSFARIAETNLKKQGILPLWFTKSQDFDKIREDDTVHFPNVTVAEHAPITILLKHKDGSTETIQATHTLNQEQVYWFYAGSAINYFRVKEQQGTVEEIREENKKE